PTQTDTILRQLQMSSFRITHSTDGRSTDGSCVPTLRGRSEVQILPTVRSLLNQENGLNPAEAIPKRQRTQRRLLRFFSLAPGFALLLLNAVKLVAARG